MQSTVPADVPRVAPTSLAASFVTVPDPRRAGSVRYPLAAILAMTVAAILANHRSVLAIAEWGADQGAALLAQLGFPPPQTPCQSTLQRLFAKLDGEALSAALAAAIRAGARDAAGLSTARPSAVGCAFPAPGAPCMPSRPTATRRDWCWPSSRSTRRWARIVARPSSPWPRRC